LHLFLYWQRFVDRFSLFLSRIFYTDLWKRLHATVKVTRHCPSQSNCLRYYNKSCDSGVQKIPVQTIPLFGLMGNWTSALVPTFPLLFKILWEFNHQFHPSLETFYSAPCFCRKKYKYWASIIGTWYFTIRFLNFTASRTE
jgi:hypothetical protein